MEDKIKNDIWKQILEQAGDFTLQANDPYLWTKDRLNTILHKNQVEICREVFDLNTPYISIVGSRGGGKSFAVCVGLIKLSLDNPGIEIGVFGPRADQAARLIFEAKKILAPSKISEQVNWDKTTNDRLIFNNGSNILALSAAETSLQEGWHFAVIVVDEAHRVTNSSMSERIIPMLGSKKIFKLIKIGIPLFKNHFYKSFVDSKYKVLKHDWLHSPILLEPGYTEVDGVKYPIKILDRVPRSMKVKLFPDHPELHYDGDMTEMEFNTQYGMVWMEDANSFLRGEEPELLVGDHYALTRPQEGEEYFFGLDTSSGTLTPGKYDLDYTSLSIWRKRSDNTKEKVFCQEWQSVETLSQAEEIAGIVHPGTGKFPCSFGCVDYSNVGITAVEMFKRLRISVAGVLFSATESSSKKNFKNAMADHFQFELQAGRIKYPRLEDVEKNKVLRKHYHEWLALERISGAGLNDKINAPSGMHDDGAMSDLLAVYACDKNDTFKKASAHHRLFVSSMPRSVFSSRPGDSPGKRFL